jgi:hypothetical protein
MRWIQLERTEDIDSESEANFTRAGSRQMHRNVRFAASSSAINQTRKRMRRVLTLAAQDRPAPPSSRVWIPHFLPEISD